MSAMHLTRPAIRHFSAQQTQTSTRTSRLVTTWCLTSAVVLPFVPPALESSRERNQGYPNHAKPHPPLCFHAR
ncbi:hypothetical protein BDV06DRAFT_214438 [Aspergillus oleicola]